MANNLKAFSFFGLLRNLAGGCTENVMGVAGGFLAMKKSDFKHGVVPAGAEKNIPAPPDATSFPVVGIGSSAGGLAPLKALLAAMPPEPNMALILAQHRVPNNSEAILSGLLRNATSLAVVEAREGMVIEPDHLYVPPPGCLIDIAGGALRFSENAPVRRERQPIDHFFRSLASEMGERAAAVVLSGSGSDGAVGILSVKERGGLVAVQEPDSAEYSSMPASAIKTGQADIIALPGDIPAQLVRVLGKAPAPDDAADDRGGGWPRDSLERLLRHIRNITGKDFTSYKHSTLNRRIRRRLDIIQVTNLKDYAAALKKDPEEARMLVRDLLIGVTNFFRDPDAFASLKVLLEKTIRALPPDRKTFRVWVPAASSGEEAYSVAIVVKEAMQQAERGLDVQVYATDIDETAVLNARQGHYPPGIKADVGQDRLDRYFTVTETGYQINKSVREMLVFAVQNVLQDPPFSRMDLICCRNLLIYLAPEAQRKVLSLFHYALSEDGLLFLGSAESLGGGGVNLFEERDKKWRIFSKHSAEGFRSRLLYSDEARPHGLGDGWAEAAGDHKKHVVPLDARIVAERFILENCTDPAVLITNTGEILHIHGRTGRYLELPPGRPATNIISMVQDDVKADLASAIGLVSSNKESITVRRVPGKAGDMLCGYSAEVRYVMRSMQGYAMLLVTFSEIHQAATKKKKKLEWWSNEELREMEGELKKARERTQMLVEEYVTANDELKLSNEELQSANEELQSSNEEMETAKEELQSINEEQSTLNAELQGRLEELTQVNNDMANLMAGTDIATLFLDQNLRVRRFTPAIKRILNLIEADIGRPVSHIVNNLNNTHMIEEARHVLETLQTREEEVQTVDGCWYQMRILPYRTRENVIDGLVLTFNDITALKKIQKDAARALYLVEGTMNATSEPILALDMDLVVIMANNAFFQEFDTTPEATLGRGLFELQGGGWDIPGLREMLSTLPSGSDALETVNVKDVSGLKGARSIRVHGHKSLVGVGEEQCLFVAFSPL